jgi:hypothetical protein
MDDKRDAMRIIASVEVLTGQWLSGDEALSLVRLAQSREDLFAHGTIARGWLADQIGAEVLFRAIAEASAIEPAPLGELTSPDARSNEVAAALAAEQSVRLAIQLAESPTAADPLAMLASQSSARRYRQVES